MSLREDVRIAIDKAALAVKTPVNHVTGGRLFPSVLRGRVTKVRLESKIKILREDETSVAIAKLEKDGSFSTEPFRIATATDLHFGDDRELRFKALDMLMRHLKAAKPDLLILTGDLILSRFQHIDAIMFSQMLEDAGIYWAFTFGNHEARELEGPFKHLLMECAVRFPHCLSREGDKSLPGYCNCRIDVMKNDTELLKSLYLFDSGRDITDETRKKYSLPDDMRGYDFIKPEQIEWYEKTAAQLRDKYGTNDNFLYFHIPLKEYEIVCGEDPQGFAELTGKGELIYGNAYETVGSSPYNSGMFDAMKRSGAQAVFVGHDHVNDFHAVLDGIHLVYNQMTGYEVYNLGELGYYEKDWPNGVTITDVYPDGSFDISRRFNSMYV